MNPNNNSVYLSREKLEDLKKELEFLKSTKRKEIAENLEFAKSLGDISENAEYSQAREDQAKTEDRILQIEENLKNAVIVTKHHSSNIEVGSTVIVEKGDSGVKQKYQIVGSEESDMKQGKISNRSPLGEALFGKKKGDKVTFKTPTGITNYKILEIE
ncbi:MAG: transcription elongation factor GreA [Candidatus Paceibacterota bacterium]|jgi:transcription elongation factor GreA